jgi:predicted TPR repeat methyltransferase
MRRSSGDPIVDRRYLYAQDAAGDGDWRAAAELLEQALEKAPRWAPAWLALGEAREKLAEPDAAGQAYRLALVFDPEDTLGAAPRLARLGLNTLAALPQSYVRALFDEYAPRYTRHLRQGLRYRGPELILGALERCAPERRFASAFDLGCGDGLMGAALRPRVAEILGVDLSPAMVASARERGLYDELECEEICAFLERRQAQSAELIVAADALPYFGELSLLFSAIGRALRRGGIFAFTAESFDGEGFSIGETLRFSHSRAYLSHCAGEAGLEERLIEPAVARREKGVDAPGWVGVLERA